MNQTNPTNYNLHTTHSSSGFTFVETLVAIAILLIAVVAPLSLSYQSLAASRIARNQIIATFLAEEAIEFVRATRDTNSLVGNSWLSGLEDCLQISKDSKCVIDVPANDVAPCDSEGVCPALNYDPDTFVYSYTSGDPSPFTREVTIAQWESGATAFNEAEVGVTVSWPDGNNTRTVTIEELILNWQ